MTPVGAITRLLSEPAVAPEWFSASFIAAVPLDKVEEIRTDMNRTLGAFRSVAPNGARYTVTFERGSLQADALLDDGGAFTGLLFSRMQSAAAADRLNAIFQTDPVPAEWFSDRMLAAVPIDKFSAVLAFMNTQLGAFRSIAPAADGTYDVMFTSGTAHALIVLGPDGKIEGLIFQP